MSDSVNLMPVKRAVGIVLIYIACDVNIYLYWFVSVLAPYVVCVFVCVCVISNQSTNKKLHVSNLSKLDAC